ncbi:MAG: F0F1 ATP synthase subunit B [Lachnospiraceae bacterium]|nr:F0F1 ATP synthase subunit B [Lachnospiraceae bacterium]
MLQFNWNLLFNIINLIVLYLLLKKFLVKPVVAVMEKRKALINEGLENAKQTQEQAESLKGQYAKALEGAKGESEEIVNKAKTYAKTESDRIIDEAQQQAGKMLETAKKNIETEKKQAMAGMRSEIADLAMQAATGVVGANADVIANEQIYDRFLEEGGTGHDESDHQ